MIEGAYFGALGCHLHLERYGEAVKRIYFSEVRPDQPSILAEQIIEYVRGSGPLPPAQLDFSSRSDFQKKIFALVQEIPRGKTSTYGEIAARADIPGGARAVGQAMAKNPFAILVPCHRVVSCRGLGGYSFGKEVKEKLLLLEADQL